MREQPTNMQRDILALHMEEQVEEIAAQRYGKAFRDCTDQELYYVLLIYCKRLLTVTEHNAGEKRVYYLSAEFMTGKLLANNLINLKVYDRMNALLARNGKSLSRIEEYEPEPGLGCSGPGRLAACMLDSIATLDLPGEGIGLNYHYGLFRQEFEDHQQKELPDNWIEEISWERRTEVSYYTWLGGHKVFSRMYDIDIIGWDAGVNRLHLFDIESVERNEDSPLKIASLDAIAQKDAAQRGEEEIRHTAYREDPVRNLTLAPYSHDMDPQSRMLRLCQQYFMASNAARWILHEMHERKYDLRSLGQHAVIQINDTYPSLVIPELILILNTEKAVPLDEAISAVGNACAFTSHTVFWEDMEYLYMEDLKIAVPQLIPIIEELDRRVRASCPDPALWIIDEEERVRLAYIDLHFCFSVNREVPLERASLDGIGLTRFHELYPAKFSIRTSGITFRRWLLDCNHPLADFLSSKISDAYKRDANRLENLLALQEDPEVTGQLGKIKRENKERLSEEVLRHTGLRPDPDGIYDMQINRLHAYRRQLMNALDIIHRILAIRAGQLPKRQLVFFFGAKADPTSMEALDVLHLLLVLQDLVNKDPALRPYMQIVYIPNYNVSWSQLMIPACEVSEQIAPAFRQGMSTSGMKLMLNGAVTLGTRDYTNSVILELVGEENFYSFGMDEETVFHLRAEGKYRSAQYYGDSGMIRGAVDFITGPECTSIGHKEMLERVRTCLLTRDRFMALGDLEDYIRARSRVFQDYEDRGAWNRRSLVNIAKAGYFTADRVVEEFNREIWHLS